MYLLELDRSLTRQFSTYLEREREKFKISDPNESAITIKSYLELAYSQAINCNLFKRDRFENGLDFVERVIP